MLGLIYHFRHGNVVMGQRSSDNKHVPSEDTSYIQQPSRSTKCQVIFFLTLVGWKAFVFLSYCQITHFNFCLYELYNSSEILRGGFSFSLWEWPVHNSQYELKAISQTSQRRGMERTIRRMGPCWYQWKVNFRSPLHHLGIWLVYFNENVNYLNSSSPFDEIAKKPLMSFKHLNFYARVPITGKLRLPGFTLRWIDTVIRE